MTIDIEMLVAPLSDDAPSGPDLSYDDERVQIEAAFERAVGNDADDEQNPSDWRATIGLITAQCKRTRDLWLPVYLMRAAAQSGNFATTIEGAELLARLVEERWADVHPQLDEYGFIGRKAPCESLTRISDFLGPLSRMPLIVHERLGRYSGNDFERFHESGADAENYGMFRALIEATEVSELQKIVSQLDEIRGAIARVDSVFTANSGGDTATNFTATYEQIDRIRRAVAKSIPGGDADATGSIGNSDQLGAGDGASPGDVSRGAGGGFSGRVQSRDDVIRAIDAIADYYARCEPASPVPLALRRAREWISLDFLAVLEDIAPGGLDEAKRVLAYGRNNN